MNSRDLKSEGIMLGIDTDIEPLWKHNSTAFTFKTRWVLLLLIVNNKIKSTGHAEEGRKIM